MLDITKPVQTRDGRDVVDLCVVAGRLVGAISNPGHDGLIYNWNLDGGHRRNGMMSSNFDLVNKPEPARFVWVNVYYSSQYYYTTRKDADTSKGSARLHLLQVNLGTGETVVHRDTGETVVQQYGARAFP